MMKKRFRSRAMGLLIFLSVVSLSAKAGPFYVVVGTFSEEEGARKFSSFIKNVFSDASFRLEPSRNLYHVYVMETDRRDEAEQFRSYLQKENGFSDAWVFTDLSSGDVSVPGGVAGGDDIKMELYTGGALLFGAGANSYVSISEKKGSPVKPEEQAPRMAFTFITETIAGRSVPARISLLDQRGVGISDCKTGEVVSFSGSRLNQVLTLVCHSPGFNAETKVLALDNLRHAADITQNSHGVWGVRFLLTRLRVNEVVLLYQDLFYPDAAVLQAGSKKRLQALVALLQSNPRSEIVINTHCNPGERRDITLPGKGKSLFALSEATRRSGSDKILTRARAEVLREYLAEEGIQSQRMTAMGWGSMDLRVNSDAPEAGINERVDVELVRR